MLALALTAGACGDDGGGDDGNSTAGSSGSQSSGPGTTSSGPPPGGSTSTANPATSDSSDGGPASTGMNDSTGAMATDSGGASGTDSGGASGTDTGAGSSSGGRAAITFADMQAELQNEAMAFGNYESCTTGASCHANPARNVQIVPNPDPAQLMQNWTNIVNVPPGVTPWVTPLDQTAGILNEVPLPADVNARWLQWVQDGAPFD